MCPSGCAGHGGRHASQYKRLVYSLILALLASISLGELRNTVYTEFTVSMHERWCHSYWLRCHQTLGLARVQREITADPSQCSDPSESGRQPYQCAHVPRITAWHRKKTGRWCRLQTAQATRCPGLHQPAHAHTHEQPARARHDVASRHWSGRPSALWPIPPPTADVAAP